MGDLLEAMIEAAEQNPDTRVFTNAEIGAVIHGLRQANFDASTPNLATAVEDEPACTTCGATSRDDPRGTFCSNGYHAPDDRDAVIARMREDERTAIIQNKRVNDAIQTALERGELVISSEGWLAALSKHDRNEGGDDGE
jgi:hypothetical protein